MFLFSIVGYGSLARRKSASVRSKDQVGWDRKQIGLPQASQPRTRSEAEFAVPRGGFASIGLQVFGTSRVFSLGRLRARRQFDKLIFAAPQNRHDDPVAVHPEFQELGLRTLFAIDAHDSSRCGSPSSRSSKQAEPVAETAAGSLDGASRESKTHDFTLLVKHRKCQRTLARFPNEVQESVWRLLRSSELNCAVARLSHLPPPAGAGMYARATVCRLQFGVTQSENLPARAPRRDGKAVRI